MVVVTKPMPEKLLDSTDIVAVFKLAGGKGMAHRVWQLAGLAMSAFKHVALNAFCSTDS